jgi:hypothetical protein
MASIDDPFAMAIDTSQADHDIQTVRSWAAEKLVDAVPFMLPQTRPYAILPCQTLQDAGKVAFRFSKSALARGRPWKSEASPIPTIELSLTT